METFLISNGLEIIAAIDEQEQMVLMLADGQLKREDLTGWLNQNTAPIENQEF
jgi:death on curing protein